MQASTRSGESCPTSLIPTPAGYWVIPTRTMARPTCRCISVIASSGVFAGVTRIALFADRTVIARGSLDPAVAMNRSMIAGGTPGVAHCWIRAASTMRIASF